MDWADNSGTDDCYCHCVPQLRIQQISNHSSWLLNTKKNEMQGFSTFLVSFMSRRVLKNGCNRGWEIVTFSFQDGSRSKKWRNLCHVVIMQLDNAFLLKLCPQCWHLYKVILSDPPFRPAIHLFSQGQWCHDKFTFWTFISNFRICVRINDMYSSTDTIHCWKSCQTVPIFGWMWKTGLDTKFISLVALSISAHFLSFCVVCSSSAFICFCMAACVYLPTFLTTFFVFYCCHSNHLITDRFKIWFQVDTILHHEIGVQ